MRSLLNGKIFGPSGPLRRTLFTNSISSSSVRVLPSTLYRFGVGSCKDPILQKSCYFLGSSVFQNAHSFHSSSSHFKEDYYKILGVSKGASQSDIKKAYYQLAKKFHPDTSKGDKESEKRFQQVSEAYEVLGNKDTRSKYDQYGHAGVGQNSGFDGFGAGGFHQGTAEDLFRNFEDMFRQSGGNFSEFDMFGQGGRGRGRGSARGAKHPVAGEDVQIELPLSFIEAVHGVKKEVQFSFLENCNSCDGSGNKKGTKPKMCGTCQGRGIEYVNVGLFQMESGCRKCGGEGFVNHHPCFTCSGAGQIPQKKVMSVDVPPGVDNGMDMRLSEVGNAGRNGGSRGHVYVKLHVKPSNQFKRVRDDVYSHADISLAQAILGGTCRVKGLNGYLDLQIPPGTQPGGALKLSNRGIKHVNSNGFGDHFVNFNIKIPTSITERQRELMEEWSIYERDIHDKLGGSVNIRTAPPKPSSNPETSASSKPFSASSSSTSSHVDGHSKGFFSETFSKLKKTLLGGDPKPKNSST
eukprot:Sdes_comp18208_c0_seq1m7768